MMKLSVYAILFFLIGCQSQQKRVANLKQSDFQTTVDRKKTDLYYLKNKNGLELAVTNFGARVVELWVPDKNGQFEDIVLGHNNINDYIHYKGERFLGGTIGRYGNRIAKGQFSLNSLM